MDSYQAAYAYPEKKYLRVLVTGFRPFNGSTTNPSWLAARQLDDQILRFAQQTGPYHPHAPRPPYTEIEVHVSALEMPVVYSAVLGVVPWLHQSRQYDVILHVGVGLEGGFAVERLAHKMGYNLPDSENNFCDSIGGAPGPYGGWVVERGFGPGYEQFGEVLGTGVDVDAIVEHLKSKGLEYTSPSTNPGWFLCDFTYFCSLAHAQIWGNGAKVLFMHVPPEGSPYQLGDMTRAIASVIEYFALQA